MAREIRQIPAVVRRQLSEALAGYSEVGARLRQLDPEVLVTAARGSSDHAALYLKYLVETYVGRPVASIGPSVASIYDTSLRLNNAALVAISQSGASPDLLSLLDAGSRGGALTIAMVNAANAPASEHADVLAPLLAGSELSVAATKSFVASLVASAAIAAEWARDRELQTAMQQLPDVLDEALQMDWSEAGDTFAGPGSIYCVGRGPGLSTASEAALKLKETCGLHAEAYSSAEILHGPVVLANTGLRTLFFAPEDRSRDGLLDSAARLKEAGAEVWVIGGPAQSANHLHAVKGPHIALTPICQVVSFYVFAERLSRRLGRNPDNPAQLNKVTRTV